MKKIASYALLLTACLAVGSSASATVIAVQSASELTTAFQEAQSGDVIQLQTDIALTSTLWLGTANMTDNSRALTLDLNGHTLSRTANVRMIDVTHGSLIVQSSSAGGRVDDYASVTQQSQLKDMMLVTGSYLKDINPRTDTGYYSHLVIAEGVTINAGQNAITIDRVGNADGHSIQYGTDVYNRGTVNNNIGVAHGARVDIYGTIYANKYGIKPNGLLVAPTTDGETLRTVSSDSQYANYQVEATDTAYAPFIHVHPSALISTHATASEATAVYASGYARWLIEGGCYGNMGLYIRSGCVSVHNAYIESSNPEHSSGTTQYHGVEAEGSAIVLNARSSVGGDISLYMSGATRVVSIAGYAIEEIPTSVEDEGSYIREILLESGTLEAPEYPILVSEETNIEIGDDVNLAITESGSCGDSLTWSYSPTRRTLTITGSGAMDEISTEQQPWADFRTEIQTVSLSEGITTLSANAFSGCTNLYTINIPSTMTHIGDNAFYGCNVLSSVYWDAANYNQTKNSSPFDNAREHITGFTIGSNVTSIPHHLCFEFTALTSIVIHENIQKIGNSAFEACRALQTLQMYEGLDSIGEYAFKNCTTLTTLTIPQSVGWVGNYAFEGCGLTEIMLNDNEKCLKKNVFQDCNNVTELTIPSTWHTIPEAAFRNMKGLEHVVLPDSVDTISTDAFSYCKRLRSISIPSTVRFIGDNVFYENDSLHTIYWDAANYNQTKNSSPFDNAREHITGFTIGSNVTSIPHHLCYEFTALPSIDIPAAIQTIGNSAFEGCRAMQELTLYEGLDSIGEYAFKNCTTLTTLTIPQSVGWVGNYAFEGCGLTEIMLNDNEKCLKKNVFQECNNVTELTIPSTWHTIPEAAFRNMKGLEHVVLPDSVDTISTDAFSYCKRLRSISIPSTVRFIGDNVFYENDSLHTIYWNAANYNQTKSLSPFDNVREHVTSFTIGPNVTSLPQFLCFRFTALPAVEIPAAVHKLGTSAFDECTSLSNLTWYEGLDSIGEYAFKNCKSLTELTIPQSVVWIGHNAFESCTSLSSLTLNDNDKVLKENVFTDCNSLTQLTIPSTWRAIPYQAFHYMSGLEQVILPDSLDTIGTDAFSYCRKLRSISIPTTLKHIGDNAFYACDSLRTIYWDAANYNQTKNSSPFDNVREHVTSFTIGPNVTSLPQFLCFRFTALPAVEIPAAVHKLGTSAFDECTSLSDLTWYEGLDSIGEYAFKNCKSLTELTIPQSVVWIGHNAFESCTSLSSLTLNDNDKVLKENVFTDCNSLTQLTIPATWRAIPYQAFHYMSGLEQVILPDSLDTIGTDAFSYCRRLRSISIPTTLKHIGDNAFYACDSLRTIYWDAANYNQTKNSSPFDNVREHVTSFTIGPNVTSLPQFLCFRFTALPAVEIPAAVHKLGTSAFDECTSLSDLTWYEGLDSIGEYAFKNCKSLTELTIPQSVVWIGHNAFESCTSLSSLTLNDNDKVLKENVFTDCNSLTQLTIPSTWRAIPYKAFHYMSGLEQVILPDSLDTIGTDAFSYCRKLRSISIPTTLKHIGDNAFYACDSLRTIYWDAANYNQTKNSSPFDNVREHITGFIIGSNVTSIPHHLCFEFTALPSIEIPASIDKIGNSAFEGCHSLSDLTWYEGLDSIGEFAFKNCTSLTTLSIPQSVVWIGNYAIESCPLTEMTSLATTPPTITDNTFYNVDKSIPVSVPAGTRSLYRAATGWSDFTNYLALPCDAPLTDTVEVTICEGSAYEWRGMTLTQTGIYTDSLLTEDGCDSINTLVLTVNPMYFFADEAQTCQGTGYLWRERMLETAGTYYDSLRTVNGCDSVYELTLTVNPAYNMTEEATICQGEKYEWHGMSLTEAGRYIDTLHTINGCDSICNLVLTVNPTFDQTAEATICEGTTYSWHGKTYTTAGIYYDSLQTIHGCDSIWTLTLTVNPAYNMTEEATICQGEKYEWHGQSLTEAGRYIDTLHTVNGCDSICNLVLTVNPAFDQTAEATICEGTTYSWHGKTYTTAGIYYDSLQTINGCDSIWTLTLTVNPSYTMTEEATICQGEKYEWHGQSLTEAGRYIDTLHTVNGCDSICNLVLTVNPTFEQAAEATICQGTTYSWHGKTYTTAGIYYDSLQTIHGCDSMWTLTLTVNPAFNMTEEATICQGTTYSWQGKTYTTAGTYYDSLQTVHGCDSILTLVLTVNETYSSTEDVAICQGEAFEWHGQTYTTAGRYQMTLEAKNGCDSICTLNLTVNATYTKQESAYICAGETYRWHDRDYTTSGIYHDTLQTIHGCDSICTLNLTVNETYAVTEEAAICDGESYTWHGRSFTRRGIYADTLHTVAGCDSICTLILTVNPKYLIEDIVSVREDKLPYRWQGESINQAGDYRKEYSSIYGCDSVHTLHLVVTALPIYTVNVQADHGHVNGTGTYPEGTRITLTAVPDEGFEFQMWSDGSETNPKEFVVMQDTTFRAHFYMPEVEQEVVVDSIETHSVTITWDTVAGAVLYELRIYKNGQLVVTYEVDPDNNIIGEHHIGPDRIVARKDSTGGTSETLQVNIGGLEPGQDYTYSLDALDDDRSYVGAQSGVFTTEEEPIDGLDTLFDKQRHLGARKILRDGQLYIELPDGTRYSPEGARLDI